MLGDLLQNRVVEEVAGTLQDFINHLHNLLPSPSPGPGGELVARTPRLFKHYLSLDQQNITALLLFLK